MFTARFHIGPVRFLPALARTAPVRPGLAGRSGKFVRVAALTALLVLALRGTSSAQALGTLQVTARVVPASVGWTGVAEAGLAARSAASQQTGRPSIRRSGLVRTRAEIHPSGGRRLLLVTVEHPHN